MPLLRSLDADARDSSLSTLGTCLRQGNTTILLRDSTDYICFAAAMVMVIIESIGKGADISLGCAFSLVI